MFRSLSSPAATVRDRSVILMHKDMEASNLTIGFLGREQYRHTTSVQYRTIEAYIEQACRRTTTVTAFTGLASTFEQNMARRVLRMQGRLPNLRLVVAVNEQQQRHFLRAKRGCASISYADILRGAERTVLFDCGFALLRELHIARYFIANCNVLFHGRIPQSVRQELDRRAAYGEIRAVSLHDLHRDFTPEPLPGSKLLDESIRYLRPHGPAVSSRTVPDDLLNAWHCPHPARFSSYCLSLEYEWLDIFHLRDIRGEFLPLKVFAYTYVAAHDFWIVRHCDTPQEVFGRFKQFQQLVRYIREQRRYGKRVLDFDLFDYACYDELLRRIAPQEPERR